jgi:hypothetical protein
VSTCCIKQLDQKKQRSQELRFILAPAQDLWFSLRGNFAPRLGQGSFPEAALSALALETKAFFFMSNSDSVF